MQRPGTPPKIGSVSFVCPHCHASAHQTWFGVYACAITQGDSIFQFICFPAPLGEQYNLTLSNKDLPRRSSNFNGARIPSLHFSRCYACNKLSIWMNRELVHPVDDYEIYPDDGMPDDIKSDFIEAASIVSKSPRGAAALLRLCLQKILEGLNERGTIDNAIGNLVKRGLDQRIQQMLDVVRVLGNEAVHPGTIDLRDDKETALQLFAIVNIISRTMISNDKIVKELYNSLPKSKLAAIAKRDGKLDSDTGGSE